MTTGIIVLIIVGAIVLFVVCSAQLEGSKVEAVEPKVKVNYYSEAQEVKAKNMEKLEEMVATTDDRITNEMVQDALGVSDSTAERYLNELEQQGILKQIGKTGKYTYYKKRNN